MTILRCTVHASQKNINQLNPPPVFLFFHPPTHMKVAAKDQTPKAGAPVTIATLLNCHFN